MIMWYLNPALTRFRNEVNARWPRRDKTSDGTIGDAAHQATDSDHNPDPDGSVDAWDMDKDGVDVNACIAAAIRHESIQYVIYNRRITSRSWGLGTWRPYTGDNPHDKHVHFNTRPSHERSTAPWFTQEDDVSPEDIEKIAQRSAALSKSAILGDPGVQAGLQRIEAIVSGRDPHTGGAPNELHRRLQALPNAVAAATVAVLADPSTPDEQAAAALLSLLADRPGVLALLRTK